MSELNCEDFYETKDDYTSANLQGMNEVPFFVVRKEMVFLRPFAVKVYRDRYRIQVYYVCRREVHGEIVDFPVMGFNLDLHELRKRIDWKDCCQYGIHFKDYDADYMLSCAKLIDQAIINGANKEDIPLLVETNFPRYGTVNRNGYLINISSFLQNGRVSSLEGHALIPAYRMLNFTTKFKDTTFDKMMVSLNIDSKCPLEINTPYNKVCQVVNSMEIYRHLVKVDPVVRDLVWRPRLRMWESNTGKEEAQARSCYVGGCDLDDWIDIDIQCIEEFTNHPVAHYAEVYLEAVNGYLPKNRIMLDVAGHATFKAYPLGLESGDTMRIKAGFRYQSGLADFTIHVL